MTAVPRRGVRNGAGEPGPNSALLESSTSDRIIALADVHSSGFGLDALAPYLNAFDATLEATRLPAGILGRSHLTPSGHLIEVDSSIPQTRQWFTIAHEIAHILVDEARYDLSTHPLVPTNDIVLERLCDDIAGRILLPTRRVADLAAPVLRSGALFKAAHRCQMSPEAFSIRLNDEGFPNLFARLTRRGTHGNAEWSAHSVIGRTAHRSHLNWAHMQALPLGSTRYPEPTPTPEWGIPLPVVGEVRKGTRAATLWFSRVCE